MNAKQHRTTTSAVAWLSSAGAEVKLSDGKLHLRGPDSELTVDARELDEALLESPERAVEVLEPLASRLGVELQMLRPTSDSTRAKSFTDAAIRHTEFRRVPNPDEAELKALMPVVGAVATSCFERSKKRWQVAGLQQEDLVSYASIWAVSYLGLYKRHDKDERENTRLFVHYLRQRFSNLLVAANTLTRRPITREAAMVGQGFGYFPEMFEGREVPDVRGEEPPTVSPLRPRLARTKLESVLKSMGEPQAVEVLRALTSHEDGDVSTLAKKMLAERLN